MSLDPRVVFLARVRADSGLQRLLQDPAVASAAVSIAHAAGFAVTAAELARAPVPSRQPREVAVPSAREPRPAPAAEGDRIDFDGDGLPDAVRHGDHWELTPQDQG
ncbi:Nif11 family protein [Synechococcus sp. CCY 9618]|uniref:Nif11 family protein n=1 Tax=Synechococcus sp. CCY 9618 TaxID=2815602 RepID=UPI001C213D21|nr:Nif11 family protein [Synechococcus sp. CCY 9618]